VAHGGPIDDSLYAGFGCSSYGEPVNGIFVGLKVDVPRRDYALGEELPGNAHARIIAIEQTEGGMRLTLELPESVGLDLLNLDPPDNPSGEPLPIGEGRSVWIAG